MSFAGGLTRALRRLSAPVRRDARRAGIVVHPYRGYGTARDVFLIGRVMRQSLFGRGRKPGDGSVKDVLRRLLRRGVGGARLTLRLADAEQTLTTDKDGYFRAELHPTALPTSADGWHEVTIAVETPAEAAGLTATGKVYVPPPAARFLVISDIDDTVVETGVANTLEMMRNLFFTPAESRLVYPGLAPFYRALHAGIGGDEANPMLYVSRGPWSLYDTLDSFFQLHDIPVGPILFLREWGLTLQSPLPRRAKDHKQHLIRHMLDIYADLPLVLIGDSGQHDPEIYAGVVRENPDRVKAIYIRNVSKPARDGEIAQLAAEMAQTGIPLVLARHTREMARHAAELGLVTADTPDLVDTPSERR